MTFLVNDRSTGGSIPAVAITITQNDDGTISFALSVLGSYTGDLRGFFFDLADESLLGTLSVTSSSPALTEFRQANDGVTDLGNGANMQGLLGSDGGYDAGIEIGTAGIGGDDYRNFEFTLTSSAGPLTLEDFAEADLGLRLTSVGVENGERDDSVKLLEHTARAMDAVDDANQAVEDGTPNPVAGNVFSNDANLNATHLVTAVNGSGAYVGQDVHGTFGTLRLNADGTYTYTLDNTRVATQALAQGQVVTESFAYTARSFDELTSFSTDSASILITITGTNDAPMISGAMAGSVGELADNAPGESTLVHSANGIANFADVDLSDTHDVSFTPGAADYLGTFTATITNASTGDGAGAVSWSFSVADGAIEFLGAGDTRTQTYTLSVDDGHGGTATRPVTITITGTNDAPEIAAGDTAGDVFEDGSRSASGALIGVDIDQGSKLIWSVTGAGPMTPRADYRFLLDNLNIVRNGATFFNDDFGNGVPPPAGTNFGYFTFATFLESGGRAIMDGELGAPVTIPGAGTVIAQAATLNTDIGPDVTQGLKRDQDFKLEARFDLVMPAEDRANYLVRLSDGADDIVEVGVRRMEDGSVAVVLREVDVAGTVPVILDRIALEPAAGDNQIVLRLEHAADTDVLTASFDLLNGGAVTRTETFDVAADIFSNEGWTRAQIIGQSLATPQNGVYGTLSVEADGQWSYALNNRAANVQALAQDEHATDTFTVRVTDEHGASDTQTVTIDVEGSNDAPIITGGTNNGFVVEDAVPTATAQLFASDPDHGAVLRWSAGPAGSLPVAVPGVPNAVQFFGYSSDHHFTLDQFTVTRNGATIFDDTFSEGNVPPSAPNFANNTFASYLTGGGYTESGGRLHLDGALAGAQRGIENPNLAVGQLAVLGTNTDPADLTRGLKSDDSFKVEARFDLAVPREGEAYGISLTDNTFGGIPADQLGDDNVSLLVRRGPGGTVFVQLSDFNIVTDAVGQTPETVSFAAAPGENQIVLRLIHDVANPGVVRAEFDLLGGADGPRTLVFTQSRHIFGTGTPGYAGDDESWTRPQIIALGPDTGGGTFRGTYGSLTVQQDGQWTYTLDNGAANVQALGLSQPGQLLAQDMISVRVVDEHGLSSFRPVFINIAGSNDPVVVTGGIVSGAVQEDAIFSASGTVTFTDVDLADFHSASFVFHPLNSTALGTFALGPVMEAPNAASGSVGWSYSLNNGISQHLAEGQTLSETFTVTLNDNWGAMATQDVTVTIVGTNDGPDAVDDSYAGGGGTGSPGTLFDTESNNTIGTAQAIPLQMFAVSPSPDVGDPSLPRMAVNGLVSPGSDVDFYSLQIAAGATLTLDIDYGMFDVDTILGIYNAAGSLLVQVDDFFPETVGGGGSLFGYDSYLQHTVAEAGTYYVAVSSYPNFGPGYGSVGSSGDYVLNVSLTGATSSSGGGSDGITEDETALINVLANDIDIDLADSISVSSFTASAYGAALTLNPDGSFIYDPRASLLLQALNAGQSVTDTFTYTITDEHGASDSATVNVTVHGQSDGGNTPPQAVADTNGSDAVIEAGFAQGMPAGDPFASGNVLANDVDPDLNGALHVTALNGLAVIAGPVFAVGTYGGLQLMADGSWNYTLHDSNTATNALAQGEAASDQFTYTVSDQAGASSTTTLTIAISGTNDFPTLEPVGNTGDVNEDGVSTTGGQLVGSDPDHGAILTFGLPFQPTNVHSADYLFGIDQFTVTRLRPGIDTAAVQILNDDFGDGAPPPSGVFVNGNPAYFSTGAFTEAGGRALMDGGVAQGTFPFGGLITVGHTTVATTNNSTDAAQGLRISHDFDVMGRFDAELPQGAGQAYGIALTDQRTGFGGDDHIQLLVRHDADGVVRVVLREGDAAANSVTPIDSIALETFEDGDQIVLHLTHDLAQGGTIVGSFELFHGTQIVQSHTFAATGQIFGTETPGTSDDETFTRAMFLATSPAQTFSRTGTFGRLVLDESGEWQYFLNNADPDTQALGQGVTAMDSFDALAIDQFRMGGSRPIQVSVHGTNDSPVAVDDLAPGQVSEDVPVLINVLANDRDVDSGDLIRVATYDPVSLYGAAISLNPDGTFRYDPTSAQALQALNAGQILVDTFTYAVTDERQSSVSATVSITVAGVTDLNNPPVAAPDNNDHDLVVEAGVNFLSTPFAGDPTASGNVLANDSDPDAGQVLRVAAVNGSPTQVGALLTLTYGSLLIDADGTWTYTLDNSDPDTNALRQLQPVFAEPGVEQVTYTVADQHGAAVTQALTIRVSGTNDAPIVVADSNSAIEDVVTTVFGNVLANDSDPEGSALQLISPPGVLPGRYGTLTLSQDGSYSYQVNPALVNILAAGEVAHDICEQRYSVMEQGVGGSAANNATLLDITITGTDEAPSFADGVVFEDGARGTTGQVDLSAASTWSVTGAGAMTPWADYRFRIDNLNIVKGGLTFVNDDFGNGAPPPNGPGFSYLTGGTFTESGGRATMDGSFSVVTGPGFVGHAATLNTDTTADLNSGLKRNHDFKVEARFDLVIPEEALQTYGIRLTDAGVPGGGDDVVEIAVRRMEDGSVAVILREGNVIGSAPVVLDAIQLGNQPADNRIVLRLEHTANTDEVRGSFDLINGDVVSRSASFGTTVGHIFGNENWTRAQFLGFSPSQPQNGVYGTLSVEADGEWTYSLNNGIQNVQALAQGETVTDVFTVQATDTLGVSTTQTVKVDVVGTNDTPFGSVTFASPSAPGTVGAYVIEDGAQQVTGGLSFGSDLDHGHPVQWSVTANAVPGPVTAYSADYLFKVDQLSITRDGDANFLLDTFNDGNPPPASAPTFNYITSGSFSEPAGDGRAILDGHRGVAVSGTGTSAVVVANVAVLDTNIGAASPGRGLKSHHDFTIEARFDLDPQLLPTLGQAFGLSLSDRSVGELPLDQLGDDIVGLLVTRDAGGHLVVRFEERDSVADSVNILDSELLLAPLSGSQIVLRLEHDKDGSNFGLVQASFEVISGGSVTHEWRSTADTQRADRIFGAETLDNPYDDEVWTRAQIWAFGPDTLGGSAAQGTYGSFSFAPDGDWTYTLNNAAANVQALGQGQIAVDSFNVRTTDAHGASTSRQFNVNVIGTGDDHAAGLQVHGGAVAETLIGSPFSDLITGGGGSDLLIGLGGRDTFDFNPGEQGTDTITDFTPGVGGDVLDIRDLVQGYIAPGAPQPPMVLPYQVVPFSFVNLQTFPTSDGKLNTTVMVNSDGQGSDYVPIATLQGVGGLFLEEMIANGNLVLA